VRARRVGLVAHGLLPVDTVAAQQLVGRSAVHGGRTPREPRRVWRRRALRCLAVRVHGAAQRDGRCGMDRGRDDWETSSTQTCLV